MLGKGEREAGFFEGNVYLEWREQAIVRKSPTGSSDMPTLD